jgi:intracellular sulfur oxidation DsrE/DsrF family protein
MNGADSKVVRAQGKCPFCGKTVRPGPHAFTSYKYQGGEFTMVRLGWLAICAAALLAARPAQAGDPQSADSRGAREGHSIRIDVPVSLDKADVVFNMDHLAFAGDMPVGMNYMRLLSARFREMHTRGNILAIFHGAAAYMTLNDGSYNAYRKVTTGNPYKELIAGLLASGVVIEECAVSMKNNHWGNEDLLPGIKVNSGAVSRLIQLVQKGFVQIEP